MVLMVKSWISETSMSGQVYRFDVVPLMLQCVSAGSRKFGTRLTILTIVADTNIVEESVFKLLCL